MEISHPRARIWGSFVASLMACFFFVLTPSIGQTAQHRATVETYPSVLANAQAGDTILLAPGNYGALSLGSQHRYEEEPLTIRSDDPENLARFSGISAEGVYGITLEDLIIKYTYDPAKAGERVNASYIRKSKHITLRRVRFHGDLAYGTGTDVDGYGTAYGLYFRWVSGIFITECEFYQWYRGLVVYQSDEVVLQSSEFHELRSDGADFAEVQNVVIEENYFHDFKRHPESGDHPDMIQFWTNYTFKPTQNVEIRNNILNAGLGSWTQSIFMRNERVDSQGAGQEAFYKNLKITGNVIINSHLHGITVGETNGLEISRNTLLRNYFTPVQKGKSAFTAPTIRIAERSSEVKVVDNIVAKIVHAEDQPGWKISDNLAPHAGPVRDETHLDSLFVAARNGLPVNLAPFAYHPDGIAAGGAYGSPILKLGSEFSKNIFARSRRDPQFINRFMLDASLTQGIDENDIHWRFSDGETATGRQVEHIFEVGTVATATAYAQGFEPFTLAFLIESPQVLSFHDGKMHYFDNGQRGQVEGIPLETDSGGVHYLTVTGAGPNPEFPRNVISRFFGSFGFELDLTMRARDAGEILRIHNNLILWISPRGQLIFSLNTMETKKPVRIATGPLGMHDGQWHDVSLRYNAVTGEMSLLVDGAERARGQATGLLRPMEYWGFSFGNPFDGSSFDGDIRDLEIRADTDNIAPK